MEKEIIVNNILKRINRIENSKQFLASKYTRGSYDMFLNKLTNSQINFDEVENDLQCIAEENEKRQSKNPQQMSNRLTYNHSAKNLTPPEYNIDKDEKSRSFRKSKNQNQSINSSNVYIEPVNFESFLRDNKKPIIKHKSNLNKYQSRSRANSKDKK